MPVLLNKDATQALNYIAYVRGMKTEKGELADYFRSKVEEYKRWGLRVHKSCHPNVYEVYHQHGKEYRGDLLADVLDIKWRLDELKKPTR